MSTLGSQLKAERGDRYSIIPRMRFVDVGEKFMPFDEAYSYKISAKFGISTVIKDVDYRLGAATEAIYRCKRAIVDGVFDEYRAPLLDAVRHIDAYAPEKARDILLAVLDNMCNFEPMEQPK